MSTTRRRKASVSGERMALYRFVGALEPADIRTARAMLASDGVSEDAARNMRIPQATFRYRDSALLRRVMRALPGFSVPRGEIGHEVSADQYDGLSVVAGIES